jgi:hypothetical protein
MGSFKFQAKIKSMTEMYKDLQNDQKILQNELRKDDLVILNVVETMTKMSAISTKKTEDLTAKLKEAENKNFHLEQKIRSLRIELDEEKEAKVDLEIENIKMRKDLSKLQKSLESVNNNCYDDVKDLNLSEVSNISEVDPNITIIGGDDSDLSLLHELSDFRLLSDKTLALSPFFLTSDTTTLLPEKEVSPSPGPILLSRSVRKCPPPSRSYGKKTPGTYTKKMPSVTISVTRAVDTTKKARRRSKSVDFHIGEKTPIVPEVCDLCDQKAKNGTEDSPTLPWCPHQSLGKDLHSISTNITPVRSMMFGGGKRDVRAKPTSTPLLRSILKLPKTKKM